MDDEISSNLFCHSLCSRLRLLLRLVKVLLEFGLSGHAARDCRLGWCRDGSDGAILLLRFLLRVGYVEKPIVSFCGDIGLVLLSGLGSRRTHPVGAEGATMARRAPFPTKRYPRLYC